MLRSHKKTAFSLGLAAFTAISVCASIALAQRIEYLDVPIDDSIKDPVPVFQPPPPPPPTPPPPPEVIPPPPPPPILPPDSRVTTPPILVPTDVTNQALIGNSPSAFSNLPPLTNGIEVLKDSKFPKGGDDAQDSSGILVRQVDGTVLEKPNPHSVRLESGTILVSVRKPSRVGSIETPLLRIALNADGEVLVTAKDGVVHVLNASARGSGCKLQLIEKVFEGAKKTVFAIKPGFEFVAGNHKLTRADMRPKDGIARRRSQTFEDGKIALAEFSLQCLLADSVILSDMGQKESGAKETHIHADLSKMASVLNVVNGAHGFTYAPGSPDTPKFANRDAGH